MRMTVHELATEMNVGDMFIRESIKRDKFPFAFCISRGGRQTYYIDRERYELWKGGKLND